MGTMLAAIFCRDPGDAMLRMTALFVLLLFLSVKLVFAQATGEGSGSGSKALTDRQIKLIPKLIEKNKQALQRQMRQVDLVYMEKFEEGLDAGLVAAQSGFYDLVKSITKSLYDQPKFKSLGMDKDPRALFLIATLHESDKGIKEDFAKAFKIHSRLASDGFTPSEFRIAEMRYRGLGTPVNKKAALFEFAQACISGHEEACFQAGRMHEKADGTSKNDKTAVVMYSEACKLDHGQACFFAGAKYVGKNALERNDKTALSYFEQACEHGYPRGCLVSAYGYRDARGAEKNDVTATNYFDKACQGSIHQGCAQVGYRLLLGRGVAKQRNAGLDMLKRACEMGNSEACKNHDELKK